MSISKNILLRFFLTLILCLNVLPCKSQWVQETDWFKFPINTIKGNARMSDSAPWSMLTNNMKLDRTGDYTFNIGITPKSATSFSISIELLGEPTSKWSRQGNNIIEITGVNGNKAVFDLKSHSVTIDTDSYKATQSASSSNYRKFEEVFNNMLKTLTSKPKYVEPAQQYIAPEKLYPAYAAERILGLIIPYDASKQFCIEVAKANNWKYRQADQQHVISGEKIYINWLEVDATVKILGNTAEWIINFDKDGRFPLQQTVCFNQPKNDFGGETIMIIFNTVLKLMEEDGHHFKMTHDSKYMQVHTCVEGSNSYELCLLETDDKYIFKIDSYFNWDFIKK